MDSTSDKSTNSFTVSTRLAFDLTPRVRTSLVEMPVYSSNRPSRGQSHTTLLGGTGVSLYGIADETKSKHLHSL